MLATIDIDLAIEDSKKIMLEEKHGDWEKPVFSQHAPCYFATSEHIGSYLNNIDLQNKRALSVLASGDHDFNLIYKGASYIDSYDVNEFGYFIYYLKKVMMISSNLEQFKNLKREILASDDLTVWSKLLPRLRELAPTDVFAYYNELVAFNEFLRRKKGKGNLFPYLFLVPDDGRYSNLYDRNEESFQTLKERLEKVQVSFIFENVLDLPKLLDNRYDIVILSNIADYLFDFNDPESIPQFRDYIKSFDSLLAPNGLIVNYFFGDLGGTNINPNDLTINGYDSEFCYVDTLPGTEEHAYYRARKK